MNEHQSGNPVIDIFGLLDSYTLVERMQKLLQEPKTHLLVSLERLTCTC
jgi:hypothetical protein